MINTCRIGCGGRPHHVWHDGSSNLELSSTSLRALSTSPSLNSFKAKKGEEREKVSCFSFPDTLKNNTLNQDMLVDHSLRSVGHVRLKEQSRCSHRAYPFRHPYLISTATELRDAVEVGNRWEGDKKGMGRRVLLLVKHARTLWHISLPQEAGKEFLLIRSPPKSWMIESLSAMPQDGGGGCPHPEYCSCAYGTTKPRN